ncbi:MAG: SH3 domain-containing protein [Chloroflexi bacterium]|nr:SH3 domain-containing protein [Chloroflexota bacterium]
MDEEFNWLEYSESIEAAAEESEVVSDRRGLRRFLPRRPSLPSLPRLARPRLPSLGLPSFRRSASAPDQPSATDLLGGQAERPLDDLDERLRALRDRSALASQPPPPAHQALYDVDEILTGPELQSKPGGVISAGALSRAQQQQVEMLRDIVGGPGETGGSGGRSLRSLSAFSLSAVPRLLGTALLLLAVALPFVSSDYAEGELPPSVFPEDRHSPRTMYDLLDNLTRDDYVLVAFEYGPTAAGELDLLADLLLRHIFAQRAKPVIVSSNPIAIARARNIIRGINRSQPIAEAQLLHGEDYFVLRYLPGGALGLRELNENFADIARFSAKGLPTGLNFASLEEMTEIVLIAESAEDVRNWVEQVVSADEALRLLVATGYAAQPLAQAYADSMDKVTGPLVGIRDAFTYGEKLQTTFGGLVPVEAPVEPEVELVDANVASESQAEFPPATVSPVAVVPATALPQPTATAPPTVTPPPTATPLPTDTPVPTATEATILVVEVTSERNVNIRLGPTTVHEIVGLGYKGDMFVVIGSNGDGSWYNILLPGGVEAWIAAFLVEERVVTATEFAGARDSASTGGPAERAVLQVDFGFRLGKTGPRFYQAQPPATGDRPALALSRDRSGEISRLQAMTLGTLAAVLLIVFGNTIYAVRGLLRWRDGRGR